MIEITIRFFDKALRSFCCRDSADSYYRCYRCYRYYRYYRYYKYYKYYKYYRDYRWDRSIELSVEGGNGWRIGRG